MGFIKFHQLSRYREETTLSTERDRAVYLADIASQAGRYNDFKESIQAACKADANLSVTERSILYKGYQKAVQNLREELDSLSSYLKRQDLNAQQLKMFTKYWTKVETELIEICNDFIDLIDHYLLPAAEDAESTVFYKTMKGQQYFYMARTKSGNERRQFAEKSRIEYEEAFQTASRKLSSANVERLRLECSRCLLYYKIFNEEQRARAWAWAAVRTAFEDQPLQTTQYNSYISLLPLIKFSEGTDNEFFKDEVRKIPMEHGQEGSDEPQRRRSL